MCSLSHVNGTRDQNWPQAPSARAPSFSGRDPAHLVWPREAPGLPDSLPRFAELTDVRDDGEGSRAPPADVPPHRVRR